MAEFYIENGIDPSDPNHMDNFLWQQFNRDEEFRTAASSWPLNESELDYMGDTRGWEKIEGLPAQPPLTV